MALALARVRLTNSAGLDRHSNSPHIGVAVEVAAWARFSSTPAWYFRRVPRSGSSS
jgi:hypothetical protein